MKRCGNNELHITDVGDPSGANEKKRVRDVFEITEEILFVVDSAEHQPGNQQCDAAPDNASRPRKPSTQADHASRPRDQTTQPDNTTRK
jgi:hypothetical protein